MVINNTSEIGFEKEIWNSAEYKSAILGLISLAELVTLGELSKSTIYRYHVY